MRRIDADQIAALTDFPKLCAEMVAAYRAGDAQRALCPVKSVIAPPGSPALFLTMPALDPLREIYAVKVGTFFPRAPDDPRPTIHASVMVFCAQTGVPLAQIDGHALTALKCAAVAAIVTDHCAQTDAQTLAIIGTGVQATAQVRAVGHVRDIQHLRLTGRTSAHVHRFADQVAALHPNWKITICQSVDDAVSGAGIVATTTSSNRPLGRFDGLPPGVHINCMGGHDQTGREVPQVLLETSRLIVEDRPTAVDEAGPVHRNALDLTDLFAANAPDLRRARTVYSSTGHAFLDLLTAAHLLGRAISPRAERSEDRQPTTV